MKSNGACFFLNFNSNDQFPSSFAINSTLHWHVTFFDKNGLTSVHMLHITNDIYFERNLALRMEVCEFITVIPIILTLFFQEISTFHWQGCA